MVNEQNATQLSQPRLDAQGKPIKPDPRANGQAWSESGHDAPLPAPRHRSQCRRRRKARRTSPIRKRQVRAVGPTFIPAR